MVVVPDGVQFWREARHVLIMAVAGGGHDFYKKSAFKGGWCHHCADHIWVGAHACKLCRFVVHEKCASVVKAPCASVVANLVRHPVAHWWGPPQKFKKKFCNVCRRKLDDRLGSRCEVCRYYVHLTCKEFSVPDCKRCASYNPNIPPTESVVQVHHWREGNITAGAKCCVCHKTCGTTECLASLRCAWCCAVAHSGCVQFYDISCNYGALRRLVLPPACVSMPNTALSSGVTLGMQADNGDAKGGTPDDMEDVDSKSSEMDVFVRIYDGNRHRPYKTVNLPRSCTAKDLLSAALQEYHVPMEDASKYGLAVEEGDHSSFQFLEGSQSVDSLKLPDRTLPPIMIKAKDGNAQDSVVRVYPGTLNAAAAFISVVVTPVMTAAEVVEMSVSKYGLTGVDPRDFGLVEMNLFDGVKERAVEPDERPWQVLQSHRKLSIRNVTRTRFYLRSLQEKANVLIYVGSLPLQAPHEQYWKIMREALGPTIFEHVEEGPVFPSFGCLFMTLSSNDMALQACILLKTSVLIEQKRLMVMILPEIRPEFITSDSSPVLLLINERSGGGQGSHLLTTFRRLLNPHQVFNIAHGGPLPGLFAFRNLSDYRLLVCGGDGTIGWVLSMLDQVREFCKCTYPPLAVLPLGTGNDLARVLRWGSGYHGESAFKLLETIEEAELISVDRWVVRLSPDRDLPQPSTPFGTSPRKGVNFLTTAESPAPDTVSLGHGSVSSLSTLVDEQAIVMNNYFGMGIDADIALGFHLRREEAPEKFNSRLHNKGVYVKMSLNKMVQRSGNLCRDLHKVVSLECDGVPVKLPSGLEGIVILNIQSWASGCDAWGSDSSERFKPSSPSDGLLEVIGVNGVIHMGQIQGGLRSAIRIAQGTSLSITFSSPLPVHIDGEPWLQPACRCLIEKHSSSSLMLRRSKKKARRNADWKDPTGEHSTGWKFTVCCFFTSQSTRRARLHYSAAHKLALARTLRLCGMNF